MFETGAQITPRQYTAAAVWCNRNGAHLERENSGYRIVANTPAGVAVRLAALENKFGLPRALREVVLAENSGAQDYTRRKAQELETLARELRCECRVV